jgi:hypothetical protein
MDYMCINYRGKSEQDVMEEDVLSEVFDKSHFAGGTESIGSSERTD